MGDFVKFLRRSIRHHPQRGNNAKQDSDVDSSTEETFYDALDLEVNNLTMANSNSDEKEQEESNDCCNNNNEPTQEPKEIEHVGFKENRSWRKSFRKLRWKKKDSSGTDASTENVFEASLNNNSSAKQTFNKRVHALKKVNKRWSFSPDLLAQENAPEWDFQSSFKRKSKPNQVDCYTSPDEQFSRSTSDIFRRSSFDKNSTAQSHNRNRSSSVINIKPLELSDVQEENSFENASVASLGGRPTPVGDLLQSINSKLQDPHLSEEHIDSNNVVNEHNNEDTTDHDIADDISSQVSQSGNFIMCSAVIICTKYCFLY